MPYKELWPGLPQEIGPLIPIKKGEKNPPLLKGWATAFPTVLQAVMARHPDCNIALRLDYFLALDPDSIEALIYLCWLELAGRLPLTVSWRSASGRLTRLYRLPPGVKVKHIAGRSNYLSMELLTGRGHYCVIPPSQAGGERYEWATDPSTPVAVLPHETLRIIQGLARPRKAKNSNSPKAFPEHGPISEGQRNDFLFCQGCRKRAWGAARPKIEAELQELNRVKCAPPLEPGEVAGIAERAAKYPVDWNLFTLKLTYEDVIPALEELGGRERWVRRAALVEKLQEMVGTPGSIINPPVSVPTIDRGLRRMRAKRLVSHREGGWYKLPKK